MHNCMDCSTVFKLLILAKAQVFIASSAPGIVLVQNKDILYAESLGRHRNGGQQGI